MGFLQSTPENITIAVGLFLLVALVAIVVGIVHEIRKHFGAGALGNQVAQARVKLEKLEAKAKASIAATDAKMKAAATPGALSAVPRSFRLSGMAIATLVLVAVVGFVAKQQVEIIVYKACLITMAAVAGYWVDRELFPDSRPHDITDPTLRWKYEGRRALIVAAAMLTSGLGA